jgi:hypothetical protein
MSTARKHQKIKKGWLEITPTVENTDMDKTLINKNNFNWKNVKWKILQQWAGKVEEKKKTSSLYSRELKYFLFNFIFLTIQHYVSFSIYYIQHYFQSTFFTIPHYVPFGVYYIHSTLFPVDIFYLSLSSHFSIQYL